VIELSPPPEVTALLPGDYVEAEVEIVVFPADAKSYYGPNEPFREVLARDADTWRLVQREAAGNALQVDVRHGAATHTFPLVLAVDASEHVEADLHGGVGWLPVTFTGLASHRGYGLRVDGRPFSQAIHGNDYWQTDYDPSTTRWSQTFNLPRNDRQPLRIEFGPLATNTTNRPNIKSSVIKLTLDQPVLLRQASGGDIDLLADPAAMQPALFCTRADILAGVYPTMSDCHPGDRPDPQRVSFIPDRFGGGMPSPRATCRSSTLSPERSPRFIGPGLYRTLTSSSSMFRRP
jgi:hypothetical protein